jgi:nucleotide-binding universal stress UspA family protein
MSGANDTPRVTYSKILYATDLSEAGRLAFPHAASLAHAYGAELTVFHVVETEEFEKYVVGYISEDLWNQLKTRSLQEARDLLVERKRRDSRIKNAVVQFLEDNLPDETAEYVTYDVVVKSGDAVDEIVAQVESGGYDLVVVGNYGRRAVRDALMGSTAWHLLHRCKVPVVVVSLPGADSTT